MLSPMLSLLRHQCWLFPGEAYPRSCPRLLVELLAPLVLASQPAGERASRCCEHCAQCARCQRCEPCPQCGLCLVWLCGHCRLLVCAGLPCLELVPATHLAWVAAYVWELARATVLELLALLHVSETRLYLSSARLMSRHYRQTCLSRLNAGSSGARIAANALKQHNQLLCLLPPPPLLLHWLLGWRVRSPGAPRHRRPPPRP
mmetsp:Transcript_6948/g.11216  ORF Transcript_6948/g.11216 Transcript_6948/m.11216 type:complete len:203 (-) Transcript_6948:2823-3431(-)